MYRNKSEEQKAVMISISRHVQAKNDTFPYSRF